MATPGGGSDSPVDLSEVEELLRSEPYRFEFFQAIRLLERLAPDRKPLGRFTNPCRGSRAPRRSSFSFFSRQRNSVHGLAGRETAIRSP